MAVTTQSVTVIKDQAGKDILSIHSDQDQPVVLRVAKLDADGINTLLDALQAALNELKKLS